jgi:SAM-dependent methyltransferase
VQAALDYPWPQLNGFRPAWTGRGFDVGGDIRHVLDFEAGDSGWSDDLTLLHEDAAGEGRHPIDVASRSRARSALKRHLRPEGNTWVLLEAGCSSGFLLEELVSDWPRSLVIGSDYLPGPLHRLAGRRPSLPLLRFDLVKCPLPTSSVDAVVLLNVLEHIEDDLGAARQVARVLKPNGIAIIEVPAGPGLYDVYDRYLKHYRRYRRRDLVHLVTRAGLEVLEQSHLGCLAYPAFALVKWRNRRWLDAPEQTQRQIVDQSIRSSAGNPLLGWTTRLDERVAQHVALPFGIRCTLVATKPASEDR